MGPSRHHTAHAAPTPAAANPAAGSGDASRSDPERALAELERREALWIAAARAVSHDLRSPLTSIVAALQTMARLGPELAEVDRKPLLEAALAAAERMRRAADDLLLAAGDEARTKALPGAHLEALVRDAARSRPVPVESAAGLPAVATDTRHLARALTDLITGKHSRAARVSVVGGETEVCIEIAPAPPADRHGFAMHLIECAGGSIEWTDTAVVVSLPRHDPAPPAALV